MGSVVGIDCVYVKIRLVVASFVSADIGYVVFSIHFNLARTCFIVVGIGVVVGGHR